MSSERIHPWITFAAYSLIFFLVSAGSFSSMGVVLPAMVREMRWTWAQAGMGYTILGVACGLASFAPAILIRHIGLRATLLCGTAVLVAGFAVLATTHQVMSYLAGALLVGAAFSLTSTVPGTHVLTNLFERRAMVLGAYFTVGALGGVAGPMIYVVIQTLHAGWRAYWVVFAIAAALLGLFAIIATPRPPRHETTVAAAPEQVDPGALIEGLHDWTVARALGKVQFYVIVGGYTMYLLVNTTAHGFAVEHLTERGIRPALAAAMLSLEALIGAAISLVGGIAGERMSPRGLLIFALAALTIGMIGLAEARGIVLMLVYAVGMGIGFGLTFLASTVLLFNYFGRKANLELYSIMCLMSTFAAAGPAVGGWARDAFGGFTPLFLTCAAGSALTMAAAVFMTPPVFKPDPEGEAPLAQEILE